MVLIKARSFADAIRKGEAEARSYVSGVAPYENPYGQRVEKRYLEACDAFELFKAPASGREVYSRMELVKADIDDDAIVERLLGPDEPEDGDVRRRKFVPG